MQPDDIIGSTLTVGNACDSRTVAYNSDELEIGLVPVVLAIFNAHHPLFDPLLLTVVTGAKPFYWQDLEKAHLLFLAATIWALQTEKLRFTKNTLGTVLCHVQLVDNVHHLILPSAQFEATTYKANTNP